MTETTKTPILKTVILTEITNESPYTQSGQTSDIEFSILNRVNKNSFRELHYQVKCREYLGDANVAAHLNKDTPIIYGFRLVGERMPLDESLFSLSVKEDSYNNLIANMHIINDLEKEMKILKKDQSKLFDTGLFNQLTGRKKLVLVGPSDWMKSPLTVSLYSFIIRILTYKQGHDTIEDFLKKSNITGSDSSYCTRLKNLNVRFLLKNIDEVLGENPVSGINDDFLYNSEEVFTTSNEIDLKFIWKEKERRASYGIWKNHGEHGFVSLLIRVNSVVDFTKKDFNFHYTPVGFTWAINYDKLLKDKIAKEIGITKKVYKNKVTVTSPNLTYSEELGEGYVPVVF